MPDFCRLVLHDIAGMLKGNNLLKKSLFSIKAFEEAGVLACAKTDAYVPFNPEFQLLLQGMDNKRSNETAKGGVIIIIVVYRFAVFAWMRKTEGTKGIYIPFLIELYRAAASLYCLINKLA